MALNLSAFGIKEKQPKLNVSAFVSPSLGNTAQSTSALLPKDYMTPQALIKQEFTPRTEPTLVRRAFEATPIQTKAPPIVTQLGTLGFSLLEAIPRAIATISGEAKSKGKPVEVQSNIDLRRLGFDSPNYVTAAKQQQEAINRGENPWISGLGILSNKTLDIAFGSSLVSDLLKLSTSILLRGGAEAKIEAQNIVDAYKQNQKNVFARLKDAPEAERLKALSELSRAKTQAEKTLAELGAPTATDYARANASRYTELLGRQTPLKGLNLSAFSKPDISLKAPTKGAPLVEPLGLPGYKPQEGQAPAFGLSTQRVTRVGGEISPVDNSLLQEARKYTSAEEFAKAQIRGDKRFDVQQEVKIGTDGTGKTTFTRFGADGGMEVVGTPSDLSPATRKEFIDARNALEKAKGTGAENTKPAGERYSHALDAVNKEIFKDELARNSQLTDIWNKAHSLPELPKISSGGIGGNRGLAKVGLAPEKPRMITKSEPTLLKERIRNEARGTKVGFKLGGQVMRENLVNKFRTTLSNISNVKGEVVDYIKQNIPLNERGTFLNMVKDAKTQTDLIKTFSRVDKKAQEILVKDSIAELKNSLSKISDSNAISADYKAKIKDVVDSYELSGHTQATIDKLKATQDFIDRQASIGEDVALPQRIMDKLRILERTPKDELTLEQIRGLQNEVELLAQLGETKWATKQALYDGEKDLRKQQLLESATSINSKQVKAMPLETPPKYAATYIKARNFLQRMRIGLTPIEGLADITGMQPMKQVMDLNFGNYLSYNDTNIKGWYELTKDLDEASFKRIGAYAISKQEGGLERLANSGLTEEQIKAITLTPKEMQAYKYVREVFDREFPAIKKYALDVYNKDVGTVKNYVSFMSDNDAMNELEIYDRFGSTPENATKTKTVEQGFTEQRAKQADTKLELNIDKIFRRHTDDVAYMLTMGRDIKQYFEIVNSPEMREKLGDVGSLAWLQYLDLMARKGGSEGAKRIAILDTLRKNLALGVLSLRISSAMIQFTSFADTMATIGAEWAMKGASNIATSKEWRNFIMDNFPEIRKAVGDDVAFREFGDGFFAELGRKGLVPLQVLDGLMRTTAASGAYEKVAREMGIPVDLANPNREAIQEATRLMRQSQGSSFFKDQPLSITTNFGLAENKSVNKTILTFQSFMLNRWDNMQRQMWRQGISEKNYAKAFMSFFWMVVVASTMEEGIRRGVKYGINKGTELVTGKEEKTKSDSFLGNSVMNVVQSVPIAGQLASSMSYSSNPVPIINTFEQTISGASSVWGGKSLSTKIRGGITLGGGLGSLLGVPGSGQISQLVKGLVPPSSTKKGGNIPSLPSLPSLPKLPKLPRIGG